MRFAATTVAAATSNTYATYNPGDEAPSHVALSNGNLTVVSSSGSGVRGTIGKSSGKWYYEVTVNQLESGYPPVVGIAGGSNQMIDGFAGSSAFMFWGGFGGQIVSNNDTAVPYGENVGLGDVMGIAVDLDNRQITFYHNGVSMGVAFTSATLPAGTYYPFITDVGVAGTNSSTTNFGQNPFRYAVPAGFQAGWYQ